MTRWDWVYLKANIPACIVAIGAFAISVKLKSLQASPIFGGIASLAPWVALMGLGAAAWLLAVPAVRIWRWERGEGPGCHRCGGPLGREVHGRYGPYRRCLACQGNTSNRYYS